MIAKTPRILTILIIILVSFECKSLAVTRYVNITNPTPGAGTSWATAFNNLQSAMNAANFGDHIWVAQGTYKPNSPVGRSATFLLHGGTFIYAGFNGTETAETQRNPAIYPTILSGDIGVPGDRADNCYHVVTIENGISNPLLYDFIIRDGQADAGYPASSVAVPDNTGGGVLVLAHPGEITAFSMYNCTLTNNFAVYGGALGAFGDGGQQTNHGGSGNIFNGNQAVYGGAIANIASGGNWAAINYSSCIFINNNASGSNASVVYQSIDNGASNCMTYLYNCLFYDEAVPMFTSLTTGTGYSFSLYNCIIWKSGSPYTGGYADGNSAVVIDQSDVGGTLPSGSNIDADPMFVNAAGGDFHVPPCSPVVDAGFPWTFANMGETDFDKNNRVQGSMDIGPYEQVKGTVSAAPTATAPAPYCQNGPASQLTATGSNLLWYTVSTGGTGVSTAPTPSTASIGSTTYYVSQTPASSCESPRAPVTVTVNAGAAAPTVSTPAPYCQNVVALPLTATGSGLLWYTAATGGTGVSVAPTPATASAGTIDYYVSQTLSGCESPRAPVTVTIKAGAAAPVAPSPSYCVGDAAPALTATAASGASLIWYTVASGGTGDPVAPVPPTSSAGTISYFVSQLPMTGCESQRREVDVSVRAAPAVQFSWSNACEGKATVITAATSGGAQYSWDFGGSATVTGSGAGPYEVEWTSGNAYMVTLKETSGGCQGQVQHLITVNPNPKVGIAPLASSLCSGNTISLEAYGASSYQWSPATGLSNAGIADPAVRLQNSIQYTVTGTDDNGCTASAQVTLDISPDCLVYSIPDAFTPNGDGNNDVFRVKTGDDPKGFSLIVFNRYGAKVFETSNVGIGWDGMIGGNSAPVGTYVYVLQATTSAGILVRKQGTILLVR